ncbi:MAG: Uncharacterised protein [Cryomorphaceae bacterium]|nr:MAG: Uncharacterised protein [Cryomorphaceae bacterium]
MESRLSIDAMNVRAMAADQKGPSVMPEKSGIRHEDIQSAGICTKYSGAKKLSPVSRVPIICAATAKTTTHSGAGMMCIQATRIRENRMRNNKLPNPTAAMRMLAGSDHNTTVSKVLKNSMSKGIGSEDSGCKVPIMVWLCLARIITPIAASIP